jgi:hypothetical protein
MVAEEKTSSKERNPKDECCKHGGPVKMLSVKGKEMLLRGIHIADEGQLLLGA